jgi:hypothetical protein
MVQGWKGAGSMVLLDARKPDIDEIPLEGYV